LLVAELVEVILPVRMFVLSGVLLVTDSSPESALTEYGLMVTRLPVIDPVTV
jgi:hypothetical protein